MDFVEEKCLGCPKVFKVPTRLSAMAELYEGDQKVLFCSKRCNLQWVAREGRKGQEKPMKDLIERLKS